jgi:hypothetical protein
MNWKKKLSSRKLWAAAVGIIVGLAAAFGIEENEYAQIVGIVGSIVSAVSYIFGEAKIDAAASVPIIIPEITENTEETEDKCL